MENTLQVYLQQVMDAMALNKRYKEQLIEKIRPELEEQLDGYKITELSDLEKLLGSPAQMAEELTATIPFNERIKAVKRQHRMYKALIAVLVVVAILIAALCIRTFLTQPGYYTVSTSF